MAKDHVEGSKLSMKIPFSNVVAVISVVISVFALFVGVHASFIAQRVSTSDFQAMEQVKLDTAKLIATFRSIMIKGVIYTQQDKGMRDDPNYENFINIAPEKRAIEEFLNSSTAIAYYSFVAKKSKEARDANIDREEWRVFFLQLGELNQIHNPWLAAQKAGELEKIFDKIGESEFREISSYLSDLPSAIKFLFSQREHDVIIHVTVDYDDEPELDFKAFVKFLREEKEINDPELDLFWGVFADDLELVKKASGEGANVNVTDGELINRYQNFVSEFITYQSVSPASGSH